MIEPQFIVSSPSREKALAYFSNALSESVLANHIGSAFPEQGDLTLATPSPPPEGDDYSIDWSGSSGLSCSDWLIGEIADYLKQCPNSIVLFEDVLSSPTDSFLLAHERPAYWCYQNKLFWPVTSKGPTHSTIEQALAWSGGYQIIAGFSTFPANFPMLLDTHVLSHIAFQHIASSITRLATTVYDGGGYMVWERRS